MASNKMKLLVVVVVVIGFLSLTLDLANANGLRSLQSQSLEPQTASEQLDALINNQDHNLKGIDLPDVARNQFDKLRDVLGRGIDQASQATRGFIRSKLDYFRLIKRYRRWYQEYKSMYEAAKRLDKNNELALLSPSDLLAIKFAQVDQELFEEMQAKAKRRAQLMAEINGKPYEEEQIENTDYLYEALKRLIERLDLLLVSIKAENEQIPTSVEDPSSNTNGRLSVEDFKETKEFKEAMGRVKRIALNTAKGVVAGEMLHVSRIAALNGLANYFVNNPPSPGTSLDFIVPFISLLGAANTSLLVSYLTNIKIRTAMGILDDYNPVPRVVNKLFDTMKG